MYGHTADSGGGGSYGDTIIRTYVESGKAINGYTLGSISPRHNNRDGDAILAVAKKIRTMNSNPCLLFVISDGAPYAYDYSGQSAIDDTRKKVSQAQALGFQVIQIAIEEEVPCEEMFDYYIKMTDIKNLPNDLITYVSKKVDKIIKAKTLL
jgi:nitric oxide reductase activation protein